MKPANIPQNRPLHRLALVAVALFIAYFPAGGRAAVAFSSPGFAPTRMDDQGRLLEDWGPVGVSLSLNQPAAVSPPKVESIQLDEIIPAAQARSQCGPVSLTLTAFRAPAWPAGLDVLTVRVEETAHRAASVKLALDLPETVRLGASTVTLGGRAVIRLPEGMRLTQQTRDWGWADDAVAMPGWGHPDIECDPAFKNIRAGLGGVPILYQFKVEPKSAATVLLGFCESYWSGAGQRPMVCQVEGAPPQPVDPLARWGRHKAGVLEFAARDANGDGQLQLAVLPQPGAPDQNPILNAIWVFPSGAPPNLDQIIAGRLNGLAAHYVDVGGQNDQSLYVGGKAEYDLKLPAGGSRELTFLVACAGASVPPANQSAWTLEKLRHAAAAVWRDWP